MKKAFFLLSLSTLLFFSGSGVVNAQGEVKPKKDTVNQDTYAKPTTYYATEEEKTEGKNSGSTATIAIVCGAVVVVAGVVFFLLKKRK